jgi:hypothetical protein
MAATKLKRLAFVGKGGRGAFDSLDCKACALGLVTSPAGDVGPFRVLPAVLWAAEQ